MQKCSLIEKIWEEDVSRVRHGKIRKRQVRKKEDEEVNRLVKKCSEQG